MPIGVADIGFATTSCTIGMVRRRMEHPLLGCSNLDSRFYKTIVDRHGRHFHNEDPWSEHILYQNKVLGGIATTFQAFTFSGDKVLCNRPAYPGFTRIVGDLGRVLYPSMLEPDREGTMCLDLEDAERKILGSKVKVLISCSPHDPTGRVWNEDEIRDVTVLCGECHMFLIPDEIWINFMPGGK